MSSYTAPKRINNVVYNPSDFNVETSSTTTSSSSSTGISQTDADTRYVRLNASQSVQGVKTHLSPLVLASGNISSRLEILNNGLNIDGNINLENLSVTNFPDLGLKANIASPTFTGNVTVPNLNLSNLSNTTTSSVLYYNSTSKAVSFGTQQASVAGSNTQIQYNNNGTLAGSSSLTFANSKLNAPSISALSGESQISNGNYSDPDSGVARALKVSGDGLAVNGGIKTDNLNVTSGSVYSNGDLLLDNMTLYFPGIASGGVSSGACIYCSRGTIARTTALSLALPIRVKQQFLFAISNTTNANWSHCVGYLFNQSGGPALLTNGTAPRLTGGTSTVSGTTYPAININSLESGKTYKYELYVFQMPSE